MGDISAWMPLLHQLLWCHDIKIRCRCACRRRPLKYICVCVVEFGSVGTGGSSNTNSTATHIYFIFAGHIEHDMLLNGRPYLVERLDRGNILNVLPIKLPHLALCTRHSAP